MITKLQEFYGIEQQQIAPEVEDVEDSEVRSLFVPGHLRTEVIPDVHSVDQQFYACLKYFIKLIKAHDWQKEDVKKVERLFGLRKLCSKNKRKDTESIRPRFPKVVYECRSEVKKLCVLHIKKISC